MHTFADMLSFIGHNLLRKDEQLETDYMIEQGSIVDIHIVKRTARTLRRVGIITASRVTGGNSEQVPDPMLQQWTIGKRAMLDDHAQAFEWLQQGWILKEIRLKNDGKSVDKVQYRMGYLLYLYIMNKEHNAQQRLADQLAQYQSRARQQLSKWDNIHGEPFSKFDQLAAFLSASSQWSLKQAAEQQLFPASWSLAKRMKCLDFLLAFLALSISKSLFDWKEIGAHYDPRIGGSKTFDAYKEDFLHVLELVSEQSAEILGMISGGQITPIYFAGDLRGTWSSFQAGPVHALTDLSLAQDRYTTEAQTIWFVENRAILTRLAAEPHFLEMAHVLVICVDGHLRGAHKQFIAQLLQQSDVQQTICWTDYDEAGLSIAGEIFQLLQGTSLCHKWICHDHQVLTEWSAYQQYMAHVLQYTQAEQELVIGEAADWRRWISH